MLQPAYAKLHRSKETTLALLPEKTLTPEDEELARKKANLADLEAQLAERELELASFLAELVHFEKRYLQTVGRRYAILDELESRIHCDDMASVRSVTQLACVARSVCRGKQRKRLIEKTPAARYEAGREAKKPSGYCFPRRRNASVAA
jgi:hypothetical protein